MNRQVLVSFLLDHKLNDLGSYMVLAQSSTPIRRVGPGPGLELVLGENHPAAPRQTMEWIWLVRWDRWGHFTSQTGKTARTTHFFLLPMGVGSRFGGKPRSFGKNRLAAPRRTMEWIWVVRWGRWGHFTSQTGKTAQIARFLRLSMGIISSQFGGEPGSFWAKSHGGPPTVCGVNLVGSAGPLGTFYKSNNHIWSLWL